MSLQKIRGEIIQYCRGKLIYHLMDLILVEMMFRSLKFQSSLRSDSRRRNKRLYHFADLGSPKKAIPGMCLNGLIELYSHSAFSYDLGTIQELN